MSPSSLNATPLSNAVLRSSLHFIFKSSRNDTFIFPFTTGYGPRGLEWHLKCSFFNFIYISMSICCSSIYVKTRILKKIWCLWDFSWEGGTLPQNSYKPFPGPMRSFPVRENPIGSAVNEILRYRQTNKHPVTLLSSFI